jgi:Polyketide cyclase / dehydrase and lipid transport
MLRTIAIVAAVIAVPIAGLLVYAATIPDTFRIQRTTSVNAPPEKIFALINDFRNWGAWSPYETKDPAMKRTLSGAPAGKGAVYAWDGDKNVGTGRMEIADASPSRIRINLDFEKPFKANNIAEFMMEPNGVATNVTWAMYGSSPYLAKVMCIFIDMDSMVGKDFEAGLSSLKAAAEK